MQKQKEKLTMPQVRHIIGKIKNYPGHKTFGVILTSSDLTGNPAKNSGVWSAILHAATHGIYVIVINRTDLDRISEEKTSLLYIIQTQIQDPYNFRNKYDESILQQNEKVSEAAREIWRT